MADFKYTNFNVPNLLGKEVSDVKQEKIDITNALSTYSQLKESKKPFVLEFSFADSEGNLSVVIDGIEIVLPYEYIAEEESSEEMKYQRASRLAFKYEVCVKEVDEANKRVIVEYKGNRLKQRKIIIHKINELLKKEKTVNSEINAEMEEMAKKMRLKIVDDLNASGKTIEPRTLDKILRVKKHAEMNKEYAKRGVNRIIVDAVVRKVFKDGALIDIKGYGIAGYIPKHYWAYTYIHSMQTVVSAGDIISVVIIGFTNRIGKEEVDVDATKITSLYLCARTPLIDNPWDKIKFKRNDIIKVVCTSVERTHWYGSIPGYDMEIYCEFPDAEHQSKLRIIQGQTYECFIKTVDSERLLLKAKPFLTLTDRHE